MKILETKRLVLRKICVDDAAFCLELVDEPSWLQYIREKGVRTLEDARASILSGPIAMQERLGFSLYLTALKEDGVPIGLCALIKRVSAVGLDEQKIRLYIRDQEEEEKRQELLPFGGLQSPSQGKPGA